MRQSTFLLEERPVRASPSRDYGKDLLTRAATSCSPILPSLSAIAPRGWSGKTSPEHCQWTEGKPFPRSSGGWQNSGIMRPGECLTLSLSEWTALEGQSLKDEGVSSLSDILVTGDVPQRYFLSAKACAGILRRAARRGKTLPVLLARALQAVVEAQERAPTKPQPDTCSL